MIKSFFVGDAPGLRRSNKINPTLRGRCRDTSPDRLIKFGDSELSSISI